MVFPKALQPPSSEAYNPSADGGALTYPAQHRSLIFLGYCGVLVIFVACVLLLVRLPPTTPSIAAVVVPHHDIVKKQRLEFWRQLMRKIDSTAIKNVIIIGPNHFGENQQVISYDNTDWTTASASLKNLLKDQNTIPAAFRKDTGLIKGDHAVVNLIGEVKQNFPNARFAPFLIGRDVSFEKLPMFTNYIETLCGKSDCLLIASVDFSHYLKEAVANAQDKRTVTLLAAKTLTENSLNKHGTIEADSPQALYVMQEFARARRLNYWWLQNQTNSAFGNPNTTDTTSHVFAGYLKR